MPLSYLNVDVINPSTVNTVNINGISLRSLPGSNPSTVNKYIGAQAPSTTSGYSNLMVGGGGSAITTGYNNIVVGLFSGGSLTVGDSNVVLGANAFGNADLDSENIVIGAAALGTIASSSVGQVAIGHFALRYLATVTSSPNTAVGHFALASATAAGGNTVLGAQAGEFVTTGSDNTFLGKDSGNGNGNNPITTGSNNICIGVNSGAVASTTSNSITLGNSSNNVLRCAVTSITSLSDARDKKDVAPIELGLDFVKELNPVKFVWNDRDESGKHDVADSGFIAQDLKSLEDKYNASEVLKLVYDENPEKLEASYGRLVPVLVQAIKDLAAKVEQLENK